MTEAGQADAIDGSQAQPRNPVWTGLSVYAITTGLVVMGVLFGHLFVAPPAPAPGDQALGKKKPLGECFAAQDGTWYKRIVTKGYSYDPDSRSPVAFFPLFPSLAAGVARLTGLGPVAAMLAVSNACLAASFAAAAVYLRGRGLAPGADTNALLAFGLMPATFFFRMTYAESTLLLSCLLLLVGVQRRWPLGGVALIAGLGTAARPVGVSLLVPLLIYAWHCHPRPASFLARVVPVAAAGCWGIAAYALYLYVWFGDPLAFAQTQTHWGSPAPSLTDKLYKLITYEPIWGNFLRGANLRSMLFTWELVNPVYFCATVTLIICGAFRGALNTYEVALAVPLLAIPYLTRAYEMHMASFARFAAAVFPAYIVIGAGLNRLPTAVSTCLLALGAFFTGAFAAMFAGGYPVF